jgi:hypothetical protein
MSVNFYETTLRNIPQDSHFHTRRRKNLKPHPEGTLNRSTARIVEIRNAYKVLVGKPQVRRSLWDISMDHTEREYKE